MAEEEKKEKKKKSKKKAEAEAAAPPPPEAAPAEEVSAEPQTPEEEPADTPTSTPLKKASSKKKARRSGSNIFAMFTEWKIHEFKEAFQLIDQNKDGFITKSDLKITFDSLGRDVEDEDLEAMLAEAPGPLNFTMFLTIFGERISGTDDEDVVLNSFQQFDEGDGRMKEEVFKDRLKKRGDKFSNEEANLCLKEAPVDKEGYISIRRFARIITKGEEELDDDTEKC